MISTPVGQELLIALSVGEVALIYALPLALLVTLWLGISFIIYAAVRSPLEFAFKHDLLCKFEAKKRLPSGKGRLSFIHVAKLILGDNCIQAALLYRVTHFLVRHRLRSAAEVFYAFSRFATHADLSPWADIGPGLYLYHGLGTVVGKGSRIGNGALICQGVSIGGRAVVGDDVKLWPGAKIVGRVTIGDRSEVGANAVVIADVPPDSVVFGVPARLAGRKQTESMEAELQASLPVQPNA